MVAQSKSNSPLAYIIEIENVGQLPDLKEDISSSYGRDQYIRIPETAHFAFKMKNEGIENLISFANIAYDLKTNNERFTLFALAGVGCAQSKFINIKKYDVAFQGKLGATYKFNNFSIFGGYQYVEMGHNVFRGVKPTVDIKGIGKGTKLLAGNYYQISPQKNVVASTTANVEIDLGYHGPFVGVKMQF